MQRECFLFSVGCVKVGLQCENVSFQSVFATTWSFSAKLKGQVRQWTNGSAERPLIQTNHKYSLFYKYYSRQISALKKVVFISTTTTIFRRYNTHRKELIHKSWNLKVNFGYFIPSFTYCLSSPQEQLWVAVYADMKVISLETIPHVSKGILNSNSKAGNKPSEEVNVSNTLLIGWMVDR